MIKSLTACLSACALFSSTVLAAAPCNMGSPTGLYQEFGPIQYGTNRTHEVLNLFTPTAAQLSALGLTQSAAVVVIHGHGAEYNDKGFSNICEKFASNGITCASIEYPESAGSTAWVSYAAVNCALRWVRANGGKYNYETDRVGVYGDSLGGLQAMWQVATQTMSETPNLHQSVVDADCPNAGTRAGVEAAVIAYGVADFALPFSSSNGSRPLDRSAAGTELSPISYLNSLTPQIVTVGNYDSTVNPVNTGEWIKRLIALGSKNVYVDPTSKSACAVGAVCGGPFRGPYQYWELGGFGHGYQVFNDWPTGPNDLPVPTSYTCAVVAFYWNILLQSSGTAALASVSPQHAQADAMLAGLAQ